MQLHTKCLDSLGTVQANKLDSLQVHYFGKILSKQQRYTD